MFTTVPQGDLKAVPAAARAAEAEGHDGIVTMENQHEPFLALAVAGAATEKLELHTSVAIAFARTPMAVAEVGWDLAGSTGGRFVVGLGSQVRAHNERRFSVAWTPPAPRMRRNTCRCCARSGAGWVTGEKPAYEGQHYRFTLMTPNFTPPKIACPPPAITIAAVGPAMLKVAAEECDGVKLHGFCTREIPNRRDHAAHRQPASQKPAATRARYEDFRRGVPRHWTGRRGGRRAALSGCASASRLHGSTPAYYPVLAVHGLEDLGLRLNAIVRQGKWSRDGEGGARRCRAAFSPRSAAMTRSSSAITEPALAASPTR